MTLPSIEASSTAAQTAHPQIGLIVAPWLLSALAHLDLSAHCTILGSKCMGGGAYGDIWRGYCRLKDRGTTQVAIKRLRFFLSEDIKLLFEKEIYVWSKLKHDNVLPLLGFSFDDESGHPLLVSEWMSNGSAWTYVNRHKDCDVMHLVIGAARGLEYLHEKGVVHSDVKSDNILVSASGEALVCDFGSARMVSASRSLANRTPGLKGTLRYLSLELVVGSEEELMGHTLQSDVWAFATTVCELLSRQRPYEQYQRDAQVMSAIARYELPRFPDPETLNISLDLFDILADICLDCWAKDPMERPDMAIVLNKLLDATEGQKLPDSDSKSNSDSDSTPLATPI